MRPSVHFCTNVCTFVFSYDPLPVCAYLLTNGLRVFLFTLCFLDFTNADLYLASRPIPSATVHPASKTIECPLRPLERLENLIDCVRYLKLITC